MAGFTGTSVPCQSEYGYDISSHHDTEYCLVPGSAGLIGDDMMKCFGKQSEYPRTAKAQWGEALEHTADIRDSALVHPLRAGHFT